MGHHANSRAKAYMIALSTSHVSDHSKLQVPYANSVIKTVPAWTRCSTSAISYTRARSFVQRDRSIAHTVSVWLPCMSSRILLEVV